MANRLHYATDLISKSVELNAIRAQHQSVVIQRGSHHYASCLCGWSTDIDTFEKVDLMRAIHVHDAITFATPQIKQPKK